VAQPILAQKKLSIRLQQIGVLCVHALLVLGRHARPTT
jgi:hypothetical protein